MAQLLDTTMRSVEAYLAALRAELGTDSCFPLGYLMGRDDRTREGVCASSGSQEGCGLSYPVSCR